MSRHAARIKRYLMAVNEGAYQPARFLATLLGMKPRKRGAESLATDDGLGV